jgi:hypothetical protein
MLPEKLETNDIDVQIRLRRKESLKDAVARTVLLIAITWFSDLIFSAWLGGLHANIPCACLFTAGVAILLALYLYVSLWRWHVYNMRQLEETKRRLQITATVPQPQQPPNHGLKGF